MWRGLDIAGTVIEHVVREEARLACEGAVHGLDSLRELQLHGPVAGAFEAIGLGVQREVAYPSLTPAQRKRPDCLRCDIVVTERPDLRVSDALEARRRADSPTLFEESRREHTSQPEDCLWLEVKTVGQFTFTNGIPGPNRAYSSELIGSVMRDAVKLGKDARIEHGAVLVVVFSESREVAEHDIAIAVRRSLDRSAPIGGVSFSHTPIADRIGNAIATAAILEIAR
ncbi:MAG: hypothetical protein U0573_15425 [Phycisphaerales bacterium]|nr:hypothetical protein [Planctomycetota bacterium]